MFIYMRHTLPIATTCQKGFRCNSDDIRTSTASRVDDEFGIRTYMNRNVFGFKNVEQFETTK